MHIVHADPSHISPLFVPRFSKMCVSLISKYLFRHVCVYLIETMERWHATKIRCQTQMMQLLVPFKLRRSPLSIYNELNKTASFESIDSWIQEGDHEVIKLMLRAILTLDWDGAPLLEVWSPSWLSGPMMGGVLAVMHWEFKMLCMRYPRLQNIHALVADDQLSSVQEKGENVAKRLLSPWGTRCWLAHPCSGHV